MSDTTIGKVEFGPGHDSKLTESPVRRGGLGEKPDTLPPLQPKGQGEPPRVPMGDIKAHTVLGTCIHGAAINLLDMKPWVRAALERGLKAMQEDVL